MLRLGINRGEQIMGPGNKLIKVGRERPPYYIFSPEIEGLGEWREDINLFSSIVMGWQETHLSIKKVAKDLMKQRRAGGNDMNSEDDDEEDDEENNDGDVRGAAGDSNSKSLNLATPFAKADAHKRRYVFPFFFFFFFLPLSFVGLLRFFVTTKKRRGKRDV
jgi:hypothetical protein